MTSSVVNDADTKICADPLCEMAHIYLIEKRDEMKCCWAVYNKARMQKIVIGYCRSRAGERSEQEDWAPIMKIALRVEPPDRPRQRFVLRLWYEAGRNAVTETCSVRWKTVGKVWGEKAV